MDNFTIGDALGYLEAGLSVLPARRAEKRPSVGSWRTWAGRLPTEYEVKAWFGNHPDAVCIVTGKVSGGLECMDFDNHGELFDAWEKKVDAALLARLVVERTPSGGYHVLYRAETEIPGNLKLARGERDGKTLTLIETRGEHGLFLSAPSPGYELVRGGFAHIPTLTAEERAILIGAARSLNETADAAEAPDVAPCGLPGTGSAVQRGRAPGAATGGLSCDTGDFLVRPGDDFCNRGDIRAVLEAHGWQIIGRNPDGNELWRRPGKAAGGHSATFDGNVFYVFSSNAAPFESERGYSRFQVYATLECHGDFTLAAKQLLARGYGTPAPDAPVDFSRLDTTPHTTSGLAAAQAGGVAPRPKRILPLGELVEKYPKMRPVLIHGFLRRGETMNIIAPPKTGKSWLVTDLALSVATGTPWFGFPCEKGKVLIIDNELHCETSANRIPKVVAARGMELAKVKDDIFVENQRGQLGSIEDLAGRIEELKPYGFRLIIIDAFYRAMPKGTDENDNGTVAGIYNLIDKYAAALDCAFVLIHHTSKGNQATKSVTDVGAGAGSQSRASDTHVILRRHKEQGVVVMESVVRSFPSLDPVCLRWDWPLWNRADELNPLELEGLKESSLPKRGAADAQEVDSILDHIADLVDEDSPKQKGAFIRDIQLAHNISRARAREIFDEAVETGLLKCSRPVDGRRCMNSAILVLKGDAAVHSDDPEDD